MRVVLSKPNEKTGQGTVAMAHGCFVHRNACSRASCFRVARRDSLEPGGIGGVSPILVDPMSQRQAWLSVGKERGLTE